MGLFFVLHGAIALLYLRDMAMRLELQYVLDNWSYEQGLKMLAKYGDNPALLKLLKSGESTFFTMKLQRELSRLLDEAPDTPLREAAPGTSQILPPAQESPYAYEFDRYPASVQELIREKNKRVKEMDFLKGQLELLTVPDRKDAAFRILDLDEEIDQNWEKIRYYEANNKLPAERQVDDDVAATLAGIATIEDVFRQEKNYQTYVTRAKKGGMKAEKLPFYEAVLNGIREKKKEMLNG